MSAFSFLWRRHRVALIAMVLAVLVTMVFAIRFTMFWIYWSDPAHRDVQIEGWMTPRYVAHSYRVPREVIRDALPHPDGAAGGRITLDRIARETGISLDELIVELLTAIAQERARDD